VRIRWTPGSFFALTRWLLMNHSGIILWAVFSVLRG
jgi:hypothetical protein